jgi:hypothetical protein
MVSNEAGFSSLLTYQDWIGSPSGQDAGSLADERFEVPASCFVGVGQLDFRLTPSCPAVGAGNWSAVNDGADPSLRAVRDFYGKSRYDVFTFPCRRHRRDVHTGRDAGGRNLLLGQGGARACAHVFRAGRAEAGRGRDGLGSSTREQAPELR